MELTNKFTKEYSQQVVKAQETKIIDLRDDLRNVQVIVSHNLSFHIRAIQVECFRTCTYINFDNYILIDTISFFHNYGYLKLKDLANKLFNKKYEKKKPKYNTTLIRKIFIELYNQYEKSVNLIKN